MYIVINGHEQNGVINSMKQKTINDCLKGIKGKNLLNV